MENKMNEEMSDEEYESVISRIDVLEIGLDELEEEHNYVQEKLGEIERQMEETRALITRLKSSLSED